MTFDLSWLQIIIIMLAYFRMGAMYAANREEYANKLLDMWRKENDQSMDKGGNEKKVKIIRYGQMH